MPIYDYKCPKCEGITTLTRPMKEIDDDIYCNDCHYFGNAPRIIQKAPSVSFKGGPPTPTGVLGGRHGWQG